MPEVYSYLADWSAPVNPTPRTRRSTRIAQNQIRLAVTDDSLPQSFKPSQSGLSTQPGNPTAQNEGPDNNHSAGEDPVTSRCRTPISPPVATLDDDPNSSRRKRRKTEEPDDSLVIHERSMGVSVPAGQDQTSHRNTPEQVASGISDTITIQRDSQSSTTQAARDSLGPSGSDAIAGSDITEKRSPKQKTLKLNPNGKLLSSPIPTGVEDKTQKKPGGRRSKPGTRRNKQEEKKLVIIKYGGKGDARERIGRLIDDIVNGRKKDAVKERRAPSTDVEKQPPKPTHPFFLKKPLHKTNTSSLVPQQDHQDSGLAVEDKKQNPETVREKTNFTLNRSEKSFPVFKQRISKFPEPIDSLWPPRDLVHVRGDGTESGRPLQGTLDLLDRDQKKDKVPTVRINDKEDVLLLRMRDTQVAADEGQLSPVGNAPGTLRIPGKHVASRRVAQQAMAYELSESASTCTDKGVPKKLPHPAIAKLNSWVPNSMTAFDRGEFETHLWSQKYAPSSADEVLQVSRETLMLRDWLKYLMVSAVETGKSCKDGENAKQKPDRERRKKRRKKADPLDDFIVSSGNEEFEMDEITDSEDELAGDVTVSSKRTVIRSGDMTGSSKTGTEKGAISNVILLSGPSGCGKTASVYAVAKELAFEVFEINPGNRRSAKDILERVGDMTRNHLVHTLNRGDNMSRSQSPNGNIEEGKQNKMMSFFKPLSAGGTKKNKTGKNQGDAAQNVDSKRPRNQKQSLILLEEADLLFEEDKQFWSGVMTLIDQSKRPIIITCNDENLIPLADISFHAILRYRAPPRDLVVDYLLLLAANEGHMLKREAINDLYTSSGKDLRRSIMDLNFWCQMGVGSEKSGLDWIINRWPRGSDVDERGDTLRALSLNTYERFMGWFNRDMVLNSSPLSREAELNQESLHWWQLSVQDSDTMAYLAEPESSRPQLESCTSQSNHEQLDTICREYDYADMRSVLDVLCANCSLDLKKVSFHIMQIHLRRD